MIGRSIYVKRIGSPGDGGKHDVFKAYIGGCGVDGGAMGAAGSGDVVNPFLKKTRREIFLALLIKSPG